MGPPIQTKNDAQVKWDHIFPKDSGGIFQISTQENAWIAILSSIMRWYTMEDFRKPFLSKFLS